MTSIQDILSTHTEDFLQNYTGSVAVAEVTSVPDLTQLKPLLLAMKEQLDAILDVISANDAAAANCHSLPNSYQSQMSNVPAKGWYASGGKGQMSIEGVFNGEKMVGADGKEYHVPPNYASKSKLVEGDMMKLTITEQGRFIYKQIGPIERQRVVGTLSENTSNGCWQVIYNSRAYRILTASVTFYRGAAGDNVVILVPKDGESLWGAVENIIHC